MDAEGVFVSLENEIRLDRASLVSCSARFAVPSFDLCPLALHPAAYTCAKRNHWDGTQPSIPSS